MAIKVIGYEISGAKDLQSLHNLEQIKVFYKTVLCHRPTERSQRTMLPIGMSREITG